MGEYRDSVTGQIREQPEVPSEWTHSCAERRMKAEFSWSGHSTLFSDHVDESHALHPLWEEMRSHLDQVFVQPVTEDSLDQVFGEPDTDTGRILNMRRIENLYERIRICCHDAGDTYYSGGDYRKQLPSRAEVLLLRFALPSNHANSHITDVLNLLAPCNALHLFQVTDHDPRSPSEGGDGAELALDKRLSGVSKIYVKFLEIYEVLALNSKLLRENQEAVEAHLNELRKKPAATNSGSVEKAIAEALETMRACQKRFEAEQEDWWRMKRQHWAGELSKSPAGTGESSIEEGEIMETEPPTQTYSPAGTGESSIEEGEIVETEPPTQAMDTETD
ncbi:hypothetical protein V2A60_007129 [Cordyceps javanica]|uniref:Uncharacterized protein n=1 Tax=Cordyceps javanica TaxID=43265 RepID=A0A545VRG9_9HYPO|nr:hypothetical protein IF1G_08953 [Cordyceps javanica]TQW04323.1 hypothetical protein IF2G_08093 [Cordyceps javanica]